jgi:hypothetical protein
LLQVVVGAAAFAGEGLALGHLELQRRVVDLPPLVDQLLPQAFVADQRTEFGPGAIARHVERRVTAAERYPRHQRSVRIGQTQLAAARVAIEPGVDI